MSRPDLQSLDKLLQEVKQEQPENFIYDREKIEVEIFQQRSVLKTLSIKLLLILGGLLGSSTFIGFFMAIDTHESGTGFLLLGLAFLIGSELLVRYKNDSAKDAIGVSFNITAYMLVAIGTGHMTESGTAVAAMLACMALLVIIFSESTICVFLGVLVLSQSLVAQIVIHKVYDLSHGLVLLLAGVLTYMSLREATLITASPKLNLKYNPIRLGVLVSLVLTLALFIHQKFLSTQFNQFWIASSFLIICLFVLIHYVLRDMTEISQKMKIVLYSCSALLLAPTLFAPSIPGALLVLLSSFYISHKPGFWIGLLALAYFIILYYYDLNLTLLAKSMVLMASGLLFLGGFILLNRYLRSDVN
jgi:hypothetical protein